MKNNNDCYSDFWLDDYDWESEISDDSIELNDYSNERTAKLVKLSAARRAISNYVFILNNKQLPVIFNDSNVNCTDNQTIHISADISKKENFDVAVGLALHESSHIKYTDFDLLKNIWMEITDECYNLAAKLNISKDTVPKYYKMFWNFVEDKYIDFMVHKSAPGYRGYYDALYEKYFNSSDIDKGLKSGLYRNLNLESYLFRVINITNKNTNLNALPGLYEIAKKLDLSNIDRLTLPKQRAELALELYKIVLTNITSFSKENDKFVVKPMYGLSESAESAESAEDESKEEGESSLDKLFGCGDSTVKKNNKLIPNSDIDNDDSDIIGKDSNISDTKREKIKNSFEKQKNFLDNNLKKKKVTKKEKSILDILEKSQTEIIEVAKDFDAQGIECILVKRMTEELIRSEEFPLSVLKNYKPLVNNNELDKNCNFYKNQQCINEGIVLGNKIGRRLQLRNEINVEKFSRKNRGKIDKRLLHELGFDCENIFYTTEVQKYKAINWHISVDASASMHGPKWERTIKLCATLAKVADMLDNVHLTISFRTTLGSNPYILIAYDSKIDKFVKIKNMFKYLRPNYFTPEGLCFEAIINYLPKPDEHTNSYFINISDGEPYFLIKKFDRSLEYSRERAVEHTRRQIEKIKISNYEILSYFITEIDPYTGKPSMNGNTFNNFKRMYGKNSNFIDTNSVIQITKTLNKKMMSALDL